VRDSTRPASPITASEAVIGIRIWLCPLTASTKGSQFSILAYERHSPANFQALAEPDALQIRVTWSVRPASQPGRRRAGAQNFTNLLLILLRTPTDAGSRGRDDPPFLKPGPAETQPPAGCECRSKLVSEGP
jgi:hypothetical protein